MIHEPLISLARSDPNVPHRKFLYCSPFANLQRPSCSVDGGNGSRSGGLPEPTAPLAEPVEVSVMKIGAIFSVTGRAQTLGMPDKEHSGNDGGRAHRIDRSLRISCHITVNRRRYSPESGQGSRGETYPGGKGNCRNWSMYKREYLVGPTPY